MNTRPTTQLQTYRQVAEIRWVALLNVIAHISHAQLEQAIQSIERYADRDIDRMAAAQLSEILTARNTLDRVHLPAADERPKLSPAPGADEHRVPLTASQPST